MCIYIYILDRYLYIYIYIYIFSHRIVAQCNVFNPDSHAWEQPFSMERNRKYLGVAQLSENSFWLTGESQWA